MIDYSMLGQVTARNESWTADLSQQQQLLLAVLVLDRGKPVPRAHLAHALWGEEGESPQSPESAVRRVVSELRSALRPGVADPDPLPAAGDTYRLRLDEQQADALRFRAKVSQARRSTGREASSLMAAALGEWGPDATGLFGGHPLTGLRARWAESNREALRTEYRDARYQCLWQDFEDHQFGRLAAECRELANEPAALHDEQFLELWMVATYRAGQRTYVEGIYQRAMESARKHLGAPLSGRLSLLAELIRTEDPQLNGPDEVLEANLLQPRSVTGTPIPRQGNVMNESNPPGGAAPDDAAPEEAAAAGGTAPDDRANGERPAGAGTPGVVVNGPVNAPFGVFGTQINNYGRPR